ncbi:hypothetical protein K469DRAFT_718130 [Zopfia rhizophila CBS 207.26]|uniref:F-box domain-containing protein n=1 Tax=Zopfia rhizophila CBS 207.26 TaxID=1314779 RepID=A0A6A6DGI4_9PEZI|nr:hypothetical protein K469DRAFT_718130 [Zopfia rhizophila CBS 207.26]
MVAVSCLLLSVPPEIRLIIYELLWVPLTAQIASNNGRLTPAAIPISADLNLLLACRQIYYEARRLAFSNHTFTITRNFDKLPLTLEPRVEPFNLIRSIAIPGYRPLHSSSLSRCYTFKEICSLVRRFKNLDQIIILTTEVSVIGRSLRSRKAHVNFRLKKAKYLQDERFVPSYDLSSLDGEKGNVGWRLSVSIGEGMVRHADILPHGLHDVEDEG